MAISIENQYVKVKVTKLEKQFIDKYCKSFEVSISEFCHLAIIKSILSFENQKLEDIAKDINTIKRIRKKEV